MSSPACIIAIAAFLSGGVAAVFTMLVVGIHKADRACLSQAPSTALGAVTRSVLGGAYHRGCLGNHAGHEESD
jgi:hypothetical protein